MVDNKIKELLRRYLEGKATSEEEEQVDDWYRSLSEGDPGTKLSDFERKVLKTYYWNSLQAKMGKSPRKFVVLWPQAIALAASVSAIVIVSLFSIPSTEDHTGSSAEKSTASVQDIVNDGTVRRQVILSDSSKVILLPGSKLQVSDEFNVKERKVKLVGQAFFEIAHNARKPFYVYTNEVVTKVLGTSFTVSAYPADTNVTVSVKSGKVSVYTNSRKDPMLVDSEKIILTPNQQAVYSRSSNKVERMLIKDPQVIIADEEVKKIRFEGAAASEIFKALEKMYGIEIVFPEDKFSNCLLTTSVKGEDFYERIDVICEIVGATYSIENTRIVIKGTGCN